MPKVNSISPLYQPITFFSLLTVLTAANYLLNCYFWTKTCKLICWYPGSELGVITVQQLPCYWHYVHLITLLKLHRVFKNHWLRVRAITIAMGLLGLYRLSSRSPSSYLIFFSPLFSCFRIELHLLEAIGHIYFRICTGIFSY